MGSRPQDWGFGGLGMPRVACDRGGKAFTGSKMLCSDLSLE